MDGWMDGWMDAFQSIRNFYARRALRIFPLYFLILFLAYWFYKDTHPDIPYLYYFTFTANFWMIQIDNWPLGLLNPLWSICIEEQFYWIAPLLIWISPKKYLPYGLWGILVLSILFRCWAILYVQTNWMLLYAHPLSRVDVLIIGALMGYYYGNGKLNFDIPTWVLWTSGLWFIVFMFTVEYNNFSSFYHVTIKKYAFITPLVIFFLHIVLSSKPRKGFYLWLSKNRPFEYLGKISFGLYLLHTPVIDWLAEHTTYKENPYLFTSLVCLGSIALAALSFELVEKRINALKRFVSFVPKTNTSVKQ
jgi:peptidoglycan/LPS O-acetylase OafA/YrhL